MKQRKNRISELRRRHHITQEGLAQILNVTQASVSMYENGYNIPTDILIALSGYFKVSIEYILYITNDCSPVPTREISEPERRLLSFYRTLSPAVRSAVNQLIRTIENTF